MKYHIILVFLLLLGLSCNGKPQQQNIDDVISTIFTTARPGSRPSGNRVNGGGFNVIVTPEPDTGESQPLLLDTGDDCQCVAYYLCSPENNTVMNNDEQVDGFGLLDVRIEVCPEAVDVCCGGTRSVQVTPPPVRPVQERPNRASGCGIRNVGGLDFTLVGNLNNEAGFGEFPWTVALIQINDGKLLCGGSLIHPQVILTGNHCIRKISPRNLKVRAGEWDTQTVRERLPFQERTASQIISHPEYDIQTLGNDVALVILQQPFTLADHINVVCLPPQRYDSNGQNCFASGWGKDVFGQAGKRSVIMKRVPLPIVAFDQCQRSLRETRLGPSFDLHQSFICAGGQKGVDTCEGDGGAPLVCPVGPIGENRYSQSGIVAWGIGCNEARPAVYANVALHRDWIDTQMRNLGYDPSVYTY